MKQAIEKLWILCQWIIGDFGNWKTEVWDRDLDGLYCCSGYECGCMGCTVRDMYGMKKAPREPRKLAPLWWTIFWLKVQLLVHAIRNPRGNQEKRVDEKLHSVTDAIPPMELNTRPGYMGNINPPGSDPDVP